MTIIPISAFKDNYIWLLQHQQHVWAVDPGDAAPVLAYLKKQHMQLSGILLTHHHPDHSGGIAELLSAWPDAIVYGSQQSKIQHITKHVNEGDQITCGPYTLKILEIPGHTLDHIAFYNDKILFCGDTLFSAGCGRVFEGTYPQMYQSLQKLAGLPNSIKIYCGHEYTLQNLRFAHEVEPENQFIQQKLLAVRENLLLHEPTLPSRMADEKEMNPFLRCEQQAVIASVQTQKNVQSADPAEIFKILREWKNNFS